MSRNSRVCRLQQHACFTIMLRSTLRKTWDLDGEVAESVAELPWIWEKGDEGEANPPETGMAKGRQVVVSTHLWLERLLSLASIFGTWLDSFLGSGWLCGGEVLYTHIHTRTHVVGRCYIHIYTWYIYSVYIKWVCVCIYIYIYTLIYNVVLVSAV